MGATKVELDERDRTTTTTTRTTSGASESVSGSRLAGEEEARTRHIKEEIDHTRGAMDQTLNELSDRLTPRYFLDQVLELFRGSSGSSTREAGETLRQVGRGVAQQVRRHPIPSLLFTAGLGWMLFEEGEGQEKRHREPIGWDEGPPATTEHAGHFVDARTGQPYDESYGQEYWEEKARREQEHREGEKSWGDTAREAGSSISHSASEAAHRVREAKDRAREGMSQLGSQAGHLGREFQGRAREFGHQMQHGMQASRESFSRGIHEYPLAAGAAAAAVGLLAGLLLPRTRAEDEMMGEQADRLKEQARSTAEEAYERGKDVAMATASAVTEEAERQGLMPEQLAEKASHIASAAQESAQQSASEEGVSSAPLKEKVQHVMEEAKHTAQEEAKRHQEEMAR